MADVQKRQLVFNVLGHLYGLRIAVVSYIERQLGKLHYEVVQVRTLDETGNDFTYLIGRNHG